jgi:hypothetical protein
VIGVYTERPTTVQALQLRPDTIDELCRWAHGYRLGPTRWIASEGCWRVSALRWYPPYIPAHKSARQLADWLHVHGVLIVGLRTRLGEQVVLELDWVE